MKERAMGIENEYAVLAPSIRELGIPVGDLTTVNTPVIEYVLREAHGQMGIYRAGRLWLPNGGCVYPDVTSFMEYASPEAKRVRDVVLQNKAGERIVSSIVERYKEKSPFSLFKLNVAPRLSTDTTSSELYVSFGCHENYMLNGHDPPHKNYLPFLRLIPFLITRQVYGGSGWWKNDGEAGTCFWRSQRAHFISLDYSNATTSAGRGLIATRAEPRLHLIMGDANMLEYALFLKIGATALMLSLFEEGLLPDWEVQLAQDDSAPRDYTGATVFKAIARAHNLNQKMILIRGREDTKWQRVSPLEVQTFYCELAHSYAAKTRYPCEESEEETRQILVMWDETLAALARNNDAEFLVGRIDWYTKRHVAASLRMWHRRRKERDAAQDVRGEIDVSYHEIADNSLYESYLVKRGIAARILTDEEIALATREPLPATKARGTRGTLRGRAIREALSRSGSLQFMVPCPTSDWEHLQYQNNVQMAPVKDIVLNDPLGYLSSDLDMIIARIESEMQRGA